VDLGVIVQRTTEVDRTQQVQTQRAAVAQQQFGLEMQSKLEQRETEVKAAPEAAHPSVNPEARREPGGQGSRHKDERHGETTEQEQTVPRRPGDRGQRLDIKL
jgi:hypothetical protein